MLLMFPLRHDRMIVRRLPFVSLAILLLNVFLFVFITRPERNDFELRFSRAVQKLLMYRMEHPTVQPNGRLSAELPDLSRALSPATGKPGDPAAAILSQLSAALSPRNQTQKTPDELAAEQEEFDRLQDEVVAAHTDDPFRRLGYIPAHPDPMKLLSSQFVHSGWMHLLFNMLFLYLSAPFIEDAWGRVAFPIFYLLGGAVAALAQASQFPASTTPLVGASGAIAAAMGAFLVRFGSAQIRFWYGYMWPFPMRFGSGTFPAPAWLVLPLWLIEQLWYAGLSTESSGTAFTAHVGGFVFGVGVAFALKFAKFESRFVDPVVEAGTTIRADPRLEQAIEQRAEGRFAEALALLGSLVREAPGNVDAHGELFATALAAGNRDLARRHGARRLELLLRSGEAELALHAHDELVESFPDVELPVKVRFAVAGFEEKSGQTARAEETYRKLAESAPADPLTYRARIRLATLALAAGRPDDARRELEAAAAHPARTPEQAPELARLLEQASRIGRAEVPIAVPKARVIELSTIDPAAPSESAVAPSVPLSTAPTRTVPSPVDARLVALGPNGLELESSARRIVVPWPRLEAIAVGLLRNAGVPDVVLLLCCPDLPGTFRVRLATMKLAELSSRPESPAPEQFARIVTELLDRSGAAAFPDRGGALGRPFTPYATGAMLEESALGWFAERTLVHR